MSSTSHFVTGFYLVILLGNAVASIDYGIALTKSLLYFEAQRSGKLPPNQLVQWRGDSALQDGKDAGIDLTGGYYDAGDNVKFGFPMAFTVTMLAWSVVEFGEELEAKKELTNTLNAIKWGTDYFIKAHTQPHVLYGEVGDGNSDHQCWERPEDMTTPRNSYKVDEQHPGSDLVGETAAAFAAAAIAFNKSDSNYSSQLLIHAKELFDFAKKFQGQYQTSISVAGQFYSSTGYEDELLWAATWLLKATQDKTYLDYINDQATSSGGTRSMFSWDDKYVGAQVLIAKNLLEKKFPWNESSLSQYKKNAEEFICNCIQKGNNNIKKTNGGLLWWQPWNNLQYVTAATFVITSYADTLFATKNSLQCATGTVESSNLITFVKSQVDYILGENPKKMSYMVGFGTNYPQKIHHRGASIVSIKKDRTTVSCSEGFSLWFYKNAPNPNILDGAIVGGPDISDNYNDSRSNFQQAEAATANTAPLVGVLARLTE
ncbi:endoglucanase 12-like [Nicotiana tabacum]|uniref:Endoglucanase n=1 Tax=Nicotiana tabacum TaxID=4097 RepID=A0A1S4BXK3_TOBAC|nr:PREDICTED: endoglucanase 12-like [Nicotiana tabacum]